MKVCVLELVVCSSEAWLRIVNAADPSVFEWFGVRIDVGFELGGADRADGEVASIRIWFSCPRVSDEVVLRRRQRQQHDAVLVLEAVRALGLEHAFDRVVDAVQLELLSERVAAAEQVLRDRRADDDDTGVALDVRRRDERPFRDRRLPHFGV